jgi:hypothetical protein
LHCCTAIHGIVDMGDLLEQRWDSGLRGLITRSLKKGSTASCCLPPAATHLNQLMMQVLDVREVCNPRQTTQVTTRRAPPTQWIALVSVLASYVAGRYKGYEPPNRQRYRHSVRTAGKHRRIQWGPVAGGPPGHNLGPLILDPAPGDALRALELFECRGRRSSGSMRRSP